MKIESSNAFEYADRIVEEVSKQTSTIFLDIHGESTSEKIAMGRYLEGRVTCVFGTHTHVQTADEQVFPGGTAYITDLGMVGSDISILGRKIAPVVKRFSTGIPSRFLVEDDQITIHGAVVEFDGDSGRATNIERIKLSIKDGVLNALP